MFVPLLADLEDACGESPGAVCEWVWDQTHNTVAAGIAEWFVARPLGVIVIVIGALVATRVSRKVINRWVDHLVERDAERERSGGTGMISLAAGEASLRASTRARTIGAVSRGLVALLIWSIAFLLFLGVFDVDLGPLLAGAGIAGVALGFGAQTMVRDFLAGFFMLVEDQFGVGDVIDVGEASGTVEGFTLRSTMLRDIDGTVWHVPNGEIQRVGNKSQQWARALLDISVAYGADLREAQEIIKAVADEIWGEPEWRDLLLEEPELWGVERLDADGIAIRLVIKTRPAEQWKVMRELRMRIKEGLDLAGIEIPFVQRTVWVRHEGDGGPPLEQPSGGPASG